MREFFKYWSLAFVIFAIFLAALYVAWLDIRREVREAAQKKATQRRVLRAAVNPFEGKTVSQTLAPVQQLSDKRRWVLDQVLQISAKLGMNARVLVLQDSKEHYLVHISDDHRLLTYRVDRDWVEEALQGNREKEEKIVQVVEGYLRRQWFGEKPNPASSTITGQKPAPSTEGAKS
ncbi:MAG: hypothetical protein QN189_02750 [Armatimonadota bacterium]|nr:hypothetical protein [Armatimonadota bacterium]